MRALAEHIEARGDFHRFKLYSVDAHLAQRFLNDHGCMPFERVRWSSSDPSGLQAVNEASSAGDVFLPFHVVRLIVEFTQGGFPAHGDSVVLIRLATVHAPGLALSLAPHSYTFERREFDSLARMLAAFQTVFESVDPDVVLTAGGDQHWFPWFAEQAKVHKIPFVLGRTPEHLQQSTGQRTVHSYGQTRHRHGAFFLKGRLHLDVKNSFIVNEGVLLVCLNWHNIHGNLHKSFPAFHPVRSSAPYKCEWPWTTGFWCLGRKIVLKTQSQLWTFCMQTEVVCILIVAQACMLP